MQVIICDDEFSTCVQLENYIEKYSQEHFIKADIDVFYDGESLCEYLKSSSSVDLLFLDIELPKCNGVEVGKYIREKLENEETEIIYISSKTNYAMKLFQCRPMDFLVKPITFPMVERTLDIVMKRELVNRKKKTVKIDRENRVFFIKDILYFRSENKTVYMVMQSGETFKFSAKLDDIESEISNKMFLRIHKSYLINHVYVQCYGTDRVKMINGDIVSISKPYRGSVKQKLIQLELG